jgi:hypothetical protein
MKITNINSNQALASVAYDNDLTSSTDCNINTLGSILLGSLLEAHNHLPKLFSKWVADYGCHIPNIDNYKTISVHTLDGRFCFAYDRNLNLIENNLNMKNDYSKDFFEFIEKKVNEMKLKK